MKNIAALLILFISLSHLSSAQERYVEVIVKDTILAEPQEWNFFMRIERIYDVVTTDTTSMTEVAPARPRPQRPPQPKKGTSTEQLKALVRSHGGTVVGDTLAVNYTLTSRGYSHNERDYVIARFNSRRSLDNFVKAAAALDDVQGQITSTFHSNQQYFIQALEARLVSAARDKAARLAQLGGKKLGDMLFISEETGSETNSFREFFENIIRYDGMGSMMRNMAVNQYPDKIRVEKTLKIRFALQ